MTPPPARRVKVRREVNMTAVLITGILVFGACVLAYLLDAALIARQGLDVRAMLTLPVGPQQWAQVIGYLTGGGVAWRLLKRTNRSEALIGRKVPEALAAGSRLTTDELAAMRALLEERLPAPEQREQEATEQVIEVLQRAARTPSRSAHRGGGPTWDEIVGRHQREEGP